MTKPPKDPGDKKAIRGGGAGRSPWNRTDSKSNGPAGKAPGRGWWNGRGPDKYGRPGRV